MGTCVPTVEAVTRDDTVDVTRPGGELSSLVPLGARCLAGCCFPEVLRAPQAERGAWLFSMSCHLSVSFVRFQILEVREVRGSAEGASPSLSLCL